MKDKIDTPILLRFLTDDELKTGPSKIADPCSINAILRNTTPTVITELNPYTCYLVLFQTRNLYLCSSALASNDTVSHFVNDAIIKKIPRTTGYNKLIVQMPGSTLDCLNVSRRTLRFIDFKLVDSYFREVSLQGNHFRF